jgi:cyanophycinase-like exopeptidase
MTKTVTTHKDLPGPVVLFGSGETSPSGRKVFEMVVRRLPQPPRLALVETPAGFELNSAQVIGRVADFLRHRLQNYHPDIKIIPARARGTPFSPDTPEIVAPLLEADMIFMGPGSPTYAARQLRDSLAWEMLLARHRLGAALVLASAATIALSARVLPVYEIYKVGEDLHWKTGLDFFGLYGLPLVFIPHWNNNDGGEELDTSRCFMGQARFSRLMAMLPADLTVLGLDEKTALIMDVQSGCAEVVGQGGVTMIQPGFQGQPAGAAAGAVEPSLLALAEDRKARLQYYPNGKSFPLSECCAFDIPDFVPGVSPGVWQQALSTQARLAERLQNPANNGQGTSPPPEVLKLVSARQAARAERDWTTSDALRVQIDLLGWRVRDTPDGPQVERAE